MKEIIVQNPWFPKMEYRIKDKPLYTNGDFSIYQLFIDSYLYVYQDRLAVSNLAGINKAHIDALANSKRPDGQLCFLYDRALSFLKQNT